MSPGDGGLAGALADWREDRIVAGVKLHHDDDEGRPLRSWFDFRTAGEAGKILQQSLVRAVPKLDIESLGFSLKGTGLENGHRAFYGTESSSSL